MIMIRLLLDFMGYFNPIIVLQFGSSIPYLVGYYARDSRIHKTWSIKAYNRHKDDVESSFLQRACNRTMLMADK